MIPEPFLTADSVCYLAGVGADASFDLAIMERYGCRVFAFDPNPRSETYVVANIANPLYTFKPVGISETDTEETFYECDHPGGISLLARGAKVDSVLPVRSVDSLMKEFGHDHIDLLKLCTEGFEYRILPALLSTSVRPAVICTELAKSGVNAERIDVADQLGEAGYALVHSNLPRGDDWKLTFVHRDACKPSETRASTNRSDGSGGVPPIRRHPHLQRLRPSVSARRRPRATA